MRSSCMAKLRDLFRRAVAAEPSVDDLVETCDLLVEVVEGQKAALEMNAGIFDAADLFLTAVNALRPDGTPRVTITIEDDPDLAEIVRHSIWSLQAATWGTAPPPPIMIGGTIQ